MPYHSAQFTLIAADRNHLLYRILRGSLDEDVVADLTRTYLRARTAEIVYAYRCGRTPVLITHWDTVFSGLVAELFPQSRFLYLHRRPEAVFKSFFGKNQWHNGQLMHLRYDPAFPGGRFVCRFHQSLQIEERIAWYLHVTALLADGLFASLPAARYRTIESESLFSGTAEALSALRHLVPGWSVDDAAFAAHFAEQRNTKDELLQVSRDELDQRAKRVPGILAQLSREGTFALNG